MRTRSMRTHDDRHFVPKINNWTVTARVRTNFGGRSKANSKARVRFEKSRSELVFLCGSFTGMRSGRAPGCPLAADWGVGRRLCPAKAAVPRQRPGRRPGAPRISNAVGKRGGPSRGQNGWDRGSWAAPAASKLTHTPRRGQRHLSCPSAPLPELPPPHLRLPAEGATGRPACRSNSLDASHQAWLWEPPPSGSRQALPQAPPGLTSAGRLSEFERSQIEMKSDPSLIRSAWGSSHNRKMHRNEPCKANSKFQILYHKSSSLRSSSLCRKVLP